MQPDIVAVQLELTNVCPLADCAECAYRFQTRAKGHMSLDFAKMVIDGAVKGFGPTINFNLNGLGEPLSYRHLAEVIEYIGVVAPNGRIELFTSLIASDEQILRVAKALSNVSNSVLLATTCHIRSFDGTVLEQTASSFKFPLLYSVVGMNPRIDLHVATNVSKFTLDTDVDIFREAFRDVLPPEKVHVVERLDSWLEYIRDVAVECSDVTSPAVCDYPFRVLHVGWDGTVLICCTDDVNGEMALGKIFVEGDVKEIWNSKEMESIRDRHNNMDVNGLAPCNRCGRTKGYKYRV